MKPLLGFITVAILSASALGQSLLNATRGIPQPNDPAGTTLWGTATVNAAGNAVTAAANATGPVRIVVGGAGTSGNATLAMTGTLAPCTMDASVTSAGGYYVIQGATAGQCHPQSAAPAPGTWVIGFLSGATTTSGSQALVHVSGFIFGNSASITGATSGGGLLATGNTLGLITCTANQVLQWNTTWGCANMTGGGSGTVSNSPVAGAVAYYAATGTTVSPTGSTSTATTTYNGANYFFMAPGTAPATPDVGIGRYANGLITISSGTSGNANGSLKSSNSCSVNSDTTSTSSVCTKTFPSIALVWSIHCAVLWSVAGGSSATVTTGVNYNTQAPAATTNLSGLMMGAGGATAGFIGYGSAALSVLGSNLIVVSGGIGSDTTVHTSYIDGTISVSASGGTFSLNVSSNSGTITAKAGSYCQFQ